MTKQLYLYFSLFTLLLMASDDGLASSLSKQRQTFLKAERALSSHRYKEFDRLLIKLEDYSLSSWLQYRRLRQSLSYGSQHKIALFIQENSDTRFAVPLQQAWLRFLVKKGDLKRYVEDYQERGNTRLQCHYYWGLHTLGKNDDALAGAQKLWLVGQSQPKACDKLFGWFQKSQALTSELAWQRIELAMGKGKSHLASYLGRFLPAEEQKILDFWLRIHRNPRGLLSCHKWEIPEKWKPIIFSHGILRLSRRDPILAQQLWDARKNLFEFRPVTVKQVEKRLALKLAIRKHPLAQEYLAKIPDEQSDRSLREWRVRNALSLGAWQDVKKAIARLPKSEQSSPRWRYWSARILEEEGEAEGSEEIFKELASSRSFYGFIAADRLNLDYSFNDHPIRVKEGDLEELEALGSFRAVREFLHFNRETEARRQWWYAVKGFGREPLLVASKLAQHWGLEQIAISTIARGEYWNDLSLRFPVRYDELIEKNSEKNKLDKTLIYGMIRRESAFDKYARSPVGARGLMQIMPATGKTIARRLKEKWRSVRSLLKPETNIRYGASYFQTLLKRFDDNPVLAMAAYNAGGHRVRRWLPRKKAMGADAWVETIPFKETRQYVGAVLTYAIIYQRQLKQPIFPITRYMPEIKPSMKKSSRKPFRGQAISSCR